MSVLVLMYHHTPEGSAKGFYDVPMHAFREQIERLIDAGVSFIRFSEANAPETLSGGTRVALTFDDGHASNAAAFEYLGARAIVPAAMIVRDWSRNDPDFLDARAIKSLAGICEFGAHGASHVALSSLDVTALDEELSTSRAYLEDILGREVRAMALPGGMGSAQVRRRALAAGYRLIGDSRPLRHERASSCVPRPAITSQMAPQTPLELARAGAGYWLRRRLRFAVSLYGPKLLGSGTYSTLVNRFK